MVTRARDAGTLARDVEHTADVALEVEAPTLAELFERAGLAMLAVMVDLADIEPRERVVLGCTAADREALLHDWLQLLLVRASAGGVAVSELAVDDVTATSVSGWGAGERIDPARHRVYTEVKGITYHGLAVRETAGRWAARIVLDV
jgi:protein archease